MFGSIGFQEIIFIFVIALIIFGPKKLPELGRFLGKTMAEFRKASNDLKSAVQTEIKEAGLDENADCAQPRESKNRAPVEPSGKSNDRHAG